MSESSANTRPASTTFSHTSTTKFGLTKHVSFDLTVDLTRFAGRHPWITAFANTVRSLHTLALCLSLAFIHGETHDAADLIENAKVTGVEAAEYQMGASPVMAEVLRTIVRYAPDSHWSERGSDVLMVVFLVIALGAVLSLSRRLTAARLGVVSWRPSVELMCLFAVVVLPLFAVPALVAAFSQLHPGHAFGSGTVLSTNHVSSLILAVACVLLWLLELPAVWLGVPRPDLTPWSRNITSHVPIGGCVAGGSNGRLSNSSGHVIARALGGGGGSRGGGSFVAPNGAASSSSSSLPSTMPTHFPASSSSSSSSPSSSRDARPPVSQRIVSAWLLCFSHRSRDGAVVDSLLRAVLAFNFAVVSAAPVAASLIAIAVAASRAAHVLARLPMVTRAGNAVACAMWSAGAVGSAVVLVGMASWHDGDCPGAGHCGEKPWFVTAGLAAAAAAAVIAFAAVYVRYAQLLRRVRLRHIYAVSDHHGGRQGTDLPITSPLAGNHDGGSGNNLPALHPELASALADHVRMLHISHAIAASGISVVTHERNARLRDEAHQLQVLTRAVEAAVVASLAALGANIGGAGSTTHDAERNGKDASAAGTGTGKSAAAPTSSVTFAPDAQLNNTIEEEDTMGTVGNTGESSLASRPRVGAVIAFHSSASGPGASQSTGALVMSLAQLVLVTDRWKTAGVVLRNLQRIPRAQVPLAYDAQLVRDAVSAREVGSGRLSVDAVVDEARVLMASMYGLMSAFWGEVLAPHDRSAAGLPRLVSRVARLERSCERLLMDALSAEPDDVDLLDLLAAFHETITFDTARAKAFRTKAAEVRETEGDQTEAFGAAHSSRNWSGVADGNYGDAAGTAAAAATAAAVARRRTSNMSSSAHNMSTSYAPPGSGMPMRGGASGPPSGLALIGLDDVHEDAAFVASALSQPIVPVRGLRFLLVFLGLLSALLLGVIVGTEASTLSVRQGNLELLLSNDAVKFHTMRMGMGARRLYMVAAREGGAGARLDREKATFAELVETQEEAVRASFVQNSVAKDSPEIAVAWVKEERELFEIDPRTGAVQAFNMTLVRALQSFALYGSEVRELSEASLAAGPSGSPGGFFVVRNAFAAINEMLELSKDGAEGAFSTGSIKDQMDAVRWAVAVFLVTTSLGLVLGLAAGVRVRRKLDTLSGLFEAVPKVEVVRIRNAAIQSQKRLEAAAAGHGGGNTTPGNPYLTYSSSSNNNNSHNNNNSGFGYASSPQRERSVSSTAAASAGGAHHHHHSLHHMQMQHRTVSNTSNVSVPSSPGLRSRHQPHALPHQRPEPNARTSPALSSHGGRGGNACKLAFQEAAADLGGAHGGSGGGDGGGRGGGDRLRRALVTTVGVLALLLAIGVSLMVIMDGLWTELEFRDKEIVNAAHRRSHMAEAMGIATEVMVNDTKVWETQEPENMRELIGMMLAATEEGHEHHDALTYGTSAGAGVLDVRIMNLRGYLGRDGYREETARANRISCIHTAMVPTASSSSSPVENGTTAAPTCLSRLSFAQHFYASLEQFATTAGGLSDAFAPNGTEDASFHAARAVHDSLLSIEWAGVPEFFYDETYGPNGYVEQIFLVSVTVAGMGVVLLVLAWALVVDPSLATVDGNARRTQAMLRAVPGVVMRETPAIASVVLDNGGKRQRGHGGRGGVGGDGGGSGFDGGVGGGGGGIDGRGGGKRKRGKKGGADNGDVFGSARAIEQAMDAVGSPTFILNDQGKILFANGPLCRLLHVQPAKLLDKPFGAVVACPSVDAHVQETCARASSLAAGTHLDTRDIPETAGDGHVLHAASGDVIPVSVSLRTVQPVYAQARYDRLQRVQFVVTVRDVTADLQRERRAEHEANHVRELLLAMVPAPIARRLQNGERIISDAHASASVTFVDLVGFTPLARSMDAAHLGRLLHDVFEGFDAAIARYHLIKVKNVGDQVMSVGGLYDGDDPTLQRHPSMNHAVRSTFAALEMLQSLHEVSERFGVDLRARAGIHSGPVIAGVLSSTKPAFDLLGETVNTASRHESASRPMRVLVSGDTFTMVESYFRGEPTSVELKGVGRATSYIIDERPIKLPPPDFFQAIDAPGSDHGHSSPPMNAMHRYPSDGATSSESATRAQRDTSPATFMWGDETRDHGRAGLNQSPQQQQHQQQYHQQQHRSPMAHQPHNGIPHMQQPPQYSRHSYDENSQRPQPGRLTRENLSMISEHSQPHTPSHSPFLSSPARTGQQADRQHSRHSQNL